MKCPLLSWLTDLDAAFWCYFTSAFSHFVTLLLQIASYFSFFFFIWHEPSRGSTLVFVLLWQVSSWESSRVSCWRAPLACVGDSQTARLGVEALFHCAILKREVDEGGVSIAWLDDSQCVGAGKIDLDPRLFISSDIARQRNIQKLL